MPIPAPDQLTSLTDTASVRRLFATLGYAPIEQISYSARTLDWPDALAGNLRGREFVLLAETDSRFFQVLWLASHPDTNGLPSDLVKRLYADLERRGNEAILVLPSHDGSTFELLLLADLRPLDQRSKPPTTFLRFSFDPRALQLHQQLALQLLDVARAGPGEAAEIAARAFRRAQQERFFRSVSFFSTYYLERRIATDTTTSAEWAALLPSMAGLRAKLAGASTNDVLAFLGWSVVPHPTPGATMRLRDRGSDVALLATLPADQPLDQALANGSSYPQLDLIAELEREKQSDGTKWGILTNGRIWRLYSCITASISGAFYEVDLADLLEFGSDDELRYFVGFFGPLGLATRFAEKVFFSSQMLAKEVGENLKKIVFEQVFAKLANGIADDLKRRGAYDGSEAQRQLIFRTTLVLLYRVLFLLYAESMRLLPTIYPPYYAGSLTRLLTEIALQPFTEAHLRKPMHPNAFWAWEWLQHLFTTVSEGSSQRGVPKYNGGLFSDGAAANGAQNSHKAAHRELASVQIGAMDLCRALDLLGRDATARGANNQDDARRLIDYAALDVRRLGSIYEGLLEYQLAENADGTLDLKQTSQGRKASGSYYTPDYIVAYIIEQAVGPVLAEREQRFSALMPEVLAAHKELERAQRQMDNERVSLVTAQANVAAANQRLQHIQHEASELLLDVKILDPAMGSGHFLVAAVDFVADRLIAILQKHKDGNPILERLDSIRAQIRASLRAQGVDELITDEQLNNVNLLRRMVMKRCVYGVDLNDMAVELARLSLWLNAFTIGAPLSFLDHHLKWGNSLIGARVQAVQRVMEGGTQVGQADGGNIFQGDLFSHGSAFAEMLNLARFIEELVEIADANAAQVEQSAALYADYEQHVVPVKRLLDLWVSQSFGSKEATQLIRLYSGSRQEVADLIDALMGRRVLDPISQRAVEKARDLFIQHRFLHWDLDFPEVFIDLKNRAWKPAEQAGFDAVVGNPPYVATGELRKTDILSWNYYRQNFRSASNGKFDLYLPFIEQAWQLITHGFGQVAYILPNKWLKSDAGTPLRSLLAQEKAVRTILNFGSAQVFVDPVTSLGPTTYTCICVLSREPKLSLRFTETEDLRDLSRIFNWGNVLFHNLGEDPWNLQAGFWDKIAGDYIWPLENMARIYVGTSTNADSVFIMQVLKWGDDYLEIYSEAENRILEIERDICIPFLRGKDIDRYIISNQNTVVLFPYNSFDGAKLIDPEIFAQKYPKAWLYLNNHKEDLEARENGKWIGKRDWYCHAYPRGHGHINKRKLLTPDICNNGSFSLDEQEQYHCLNTVYAVAEPPPDYSLQWMLSILNSTFFEYFIRSNSVDLRGGYYRVTKNFMEPFPIRRILFTTPAAERSALVDAAKSLYRQRLNAQLVGNDWRTWREHWRSLWDWTDSRLPLLADGSPDTTQEQSDAVHDLLAFLAEQMIELNQRKQAGAATFTSWLEQETGSSIDAWNGKTMIQGFWETPWATIERTLQKNRGTFAQVQGLRGKSGDAAMVPLLRSVQARWQQATNLLAPTLAAIAATDRLIDLLVYRLYGLTDEEIDLVERA